MHEKNEPLFTCLFIYTHFGSLGLKLNMDPGVLLEPYMSEGVAEVPIVWKGLSGSAWQGYMLHDHNSSLTDGPLFRRSNQKNLSPYTHLMLTFILLWSKCKPETCKHKEILHIMTIYRSLTVITPLSMYEWYHFEEAISRDINQTAESAIAQCTWTLQSPLYSEWCFHSFN